jgi:hypothetical protein
MAYFRVIYSQELTGFSAIFCEHYDNCCLQQTYYSYAKIEPNVCKNLLP